jgi:hypothetical protein
MAGMMRRLLEKIVEDRSGGDSLIANTTKAKLDRRRLRLIGDNYTCEPIGVQLSCRDARDFLFGRWASVADDGRSSEEADEGDWEDREDRVPGGDNTVSRSNKEFSYEENSLASEAGWGRFGDDRFHRTERARLPGET